MGIRIKGLNLGYMGVDRELLVFPHPNYVLSSQRREASKVWYRCPAISYVIEHPDGRILWETGISTRWAEEWLPEWLFLVDCNDITPEVCLEARLKAMGLGPEDFKYVIQGHLHTDHAGGLRLFEKAGVDIVVHEDEHKHVSGLIAPLDRPAEFFYNRVDWEFVFVRKPLLVYGDQEIMKDVWVVSLPGHTPGTMGLLVKLERTGWVLLTTDAMYLHESYGPPPVGTPITWDVPKWNQSIEKIRRLATKYEAFVFPGHDETGIKQYRDGHSEPKTIECFRPDYWYE